MPEMRAGDGRYTAGRRDGGERYYCSTFYKAKARACNHVSQKNLLLVLKDLIIEHLFCGAHWDALKQRICKLLPQWLPGNKTDTDGLKREINAAKSQLQRPAQNLLMAAPENVPLLNAAMNDIRKRIRTLESERAQVRDVGDHAAILTDILAKAKDLFRALMVSSTDTLKPVLSQLVQKFELRFGDGLLGKRRIRVVTGCDAYLFENFSFTTGSRGNWRKFEPLAARITSVLGGPIPANLLRAGRIAVA